MDTENTIYIETFCKDRLKTFVKSSEMLEIIQITPKYDYKSKFFKKRAYEIFDIIQMIPKDYTFENHEDFLLKPVSNAINEIKKEPNIDFEKNYKNQASNSKNKMNNDTDIKKDNTFPENDQIIAHQDENKFILFVKQNKNFITISLIIIFAIFITIILFNVHQQNQRNQQIEILKKEKEEILEKEAEVLVAIKELASAVNTGLTYIEYNKRLIDMKIKIDKFVTYFKFNKTKIIKNPISSSFGNFSSYLAEATKDYEEAQTEWQGKIDCSTWAPKFAENHETNMQFYWQDASRYIEKAEQELLIQQK